ncbi:MAG TPA: hypothetical protein VFZ61_14245 [Polyangiales bacterium]
MPLPRVPGAPAHELERSRAALAIGQLAVRSRLFFAHFERRAQLPTPAHWLPPEAPATPPRFSAGVLPESKYQAFRHDLLIASFHPSHRPQWTAHELCHALVGFAYRPGASTLFHVLAAWLAELVPVALWYFFDEADLRRCPRHAGGGPLFQTFCAACEREAERGPRPEDRQTVRTRREGRRFVQRELAAVVRSRRLGRPLGTRFATIDLAEDAVGYVAGHGPRLRAPEMERFSQTFFSARQGQHGSLEELEARVLALTEHLCGGAAPPVFRSTRWDYAAQDVGYRLLSVRGLAGPELALQLDALIDALAKQRSERGLSACIREYQALYADARRGRPRQARTLPSPERLFGVGYALPQGFGCDAAQIEEGLDSACPTSFGGLAARERTQLVRAFCAEDEAERAPIGRRFARFLARRRPGPYADLARVEAAITHVAAREPWVDCLDPFEARDATLQLAPGVEIVRLDHAVLGASARTLARAPKLRAPSALLVLRRTGSERVDVLELPWEQAQRLSESQQRPMQRRDFAMEETTLEDLLRAGVLAPTAYRV